MGNEKSEKLIFEAFLKASPDFAGEPIREWFSINEWYAATGIARPDPPDHERPDIVCVTDSGRRIGVELKGWIHQEQIGDAKLQERIEESLLQAIGKQPANRYRFIRKLWLSPKLGSRMRSQDVDEFRDQLFKLIEEADRAWAEKPAWDVELTDHCNDFSSYPMLGKYLNGIRFFPYRPLKKFDEHEEAGSAAFVVDWIGFPARGGAFAPEEMLEPLRELLDRIKNDERYRDLCVKVGLEEIDLLVHYDFNAFAYNTPVETPTFKFDDVARYAAESLDDDAGHFQKIFLFIGVDGWERVFELI
ncbi:MAG: hypothetical protein QOH25_1493 [Acidobacteriota bacterium]|jgi:hypothetical protein|nr:hypothetical protein [Acidobacteriota bacterium]